MSFVRRRNPTMETGNKLVDCDRCGFTSHIKDTRVQKGLRLDEACFDELDNQPKK